MEYFLLIVLWCGWCALHSATISLTFTNYLRGRLGSSYRFYRLFYNLLAIATLIPVILYSADFRGEVLFRWDGPLLLIQSGFAIIVALLMLTGAQKYDLLQLVGFRQIRSGTSQPGLTQTGKLDTSGVLSVTRHPWYLAAIIFLWIGFRDIYVSTLIINIILTVYLVIGTFLEEKKLIVEYGDEYLDYQKKVSMLFPFKWILRV